MCWVIKKLVKTACKNIFRSSRPELFFRKKLLWNISKNSSKKKTLVLNWLFNEITGIQFAILLKGRLWHRHFAVNYRPEVWNLISKETLTQVFFWEFCDVFKNAFLKNTFRWLLQHKKTTMNGCFCIFLTKVTTVCYFSIEFRNFVVLVYLLLIWRKCRLR